MRRPTGGPLLASTRGDGPLYANLYASLRRAILDGRMKPGAQLPSSRALASDLHVSRNVVLLAYDQLVAEGYAVGRHGSGTYVIDELPDALPRQSTRTTPQHIQPARLATFGRRLLETSDIVPPALAPPRVPAARYDFTYARAPLAHFPELTWRRLHARRLRAPDRHWGRSLPAEGYLPLREALAEHVARVRGITCEPQQVVIVNGSQEALALLTRILIEPGDEVVIEEPHYVDARRTLLLAGARLRAIEVDDQGLMIARLPERPVRLAYVTPSHQFPTGAVMPLARRLELLAWARRSGAYVVEDDFDSEYRYEGRPIESIHSLDDDQRVVYISTFTTVLYAALRLGYVVLPPGLLQPFTQAKWMHDRHAPVLQQQVLADFLNEGHYERYLRRARVRNTARRAWLLEALSRECGDLVRVAAPGGGLHLLVWLPTVDVSDLVPLTAAAGREGVRLYPVLNHYLRRPPAAGLLFGFSALDERGIDEGIARFARVLRTFARPTSRGAGARPSMAS